MAQLQAYLFFLRIKSLTLVVTGTDISRADCGEFSAVREAEMITIKM
jgi:hypothetical protein